jgi:hypothetical protein
MNNEIFKGGIAYLNKWFGNIDDELYPMYWNILKTIPDDIFMEVVEKIVKTFVPTAQCPFPLPFHFSKAHDEVKPIGFLEHHQAYKHFPELVDKPQLLTEEDLIRLRENIPKGIRDKMYIEDRFRDNKGMRKMKDILDG